ncbi:MAG: thiamine pyrophosphate-dependent dehydrogenase E1 component subunit alpha [Gammaproteobacteria bacterium]|nr:thiamine pyrophosphate-dependent dehydrogenase E1 component subunit alpha [Gammaproteobacteria bacterium]
MNPATTTKLAPAARDQLLALYPVMLRIRRVEERLSKLFADSEIPGFIHLSTGQEAVPAGIAAHLTPADTIAITHRGHGHALAKGVPLARFFAEMLGRDSGVCRGRGGSMHIADATVGMLGANGIVAGGIPIATGSALAHQLDGAGAIAVSCFGDGALAEGVFHECINLAALWQLPCLFLCENNGWGEFSPTVRQFSGRLATLAAAFGIDYVEVDGSDALAVSVAAAQVIDGIRTHGKPAVLECHVARFQGHFEGDPQKYRAEEEKAALPDRDPLALARARLSASGVAPAEFERFETLVMGEIEEALGVARAAALPDFASAGAAVYAGKTA